MALEISAVSDLFNYGMTEDGTPFIAERYFIEAEATNGQRWIHTARFDSVVKVDGGEECDGMVFFEDHRQEASDKCEALAERIRLFMNAGGKLDPVHWIESDPRYGSNAYQTLDSQGYFRDLERKEEY
jgi:hypothetical protein